MTSTTPEFEHYPATFVSPLLVSEFRTRVEARSRRERQWWRPVLNIAALTVIALTGLWVRPSLEFLWSLFGQELVRGHRIPWWSGVIVVIGPIPVMFSLYFWVMRSRSFRRSTRCPGCQTDLYGRAEEVLADDTCPTCQQSVLATSRAELRSPNVKPMLTQAEFERRAEDTGPPHFLLYFLLLMGFLILLPLLFKILVQPLVEWLGHPLPPEIEPLLETIRIYASGAGFVVFITFRFLYRRQFSEDPLICPHCHIYLPNEADQVRNTGCCFYCGHEILVRPDADLASFAEADQS